MHGLARVCLFIFLALVGCRSADPTRHALPAIGEGEVDRFLRGAVEREGIPGLVAIVADRDGILYQGAFGKQDVARDVSMRPEALFNIASMTKPVTSVAVMMLYEEGRLDLDDPVADYLPSWADRGVMARFDETDTSFVVRPAAGALTIRHLLTHTSGIGYDFSSRPLYLMRRKTGQTAVELPLLHDPGEQWTYGMGTGVLGQVVEKISGQPIQEFFQNRIFAPLGMEDTFFAVPEAKEGRLATRHRRVEGALVEEVPDPAARRAQVTFFADGGLRSTARDYITFLQMLMNDGSLRGATLLSPSSVAAMTRNQIGDLIVEEQPTFRPTLAQPFPRGAGKDRFGLGFQISAPAESGVPRRAGGSYSWGGVYNTHFWVDPENGIAAVLMMQVLPYYDPACIAVLRGFERRVYENLR